MEPISPQIHALDKTQYHNNNNYDTVNFTVTSTDVAPPLHQYPNRIKFIEAANHIATVTPNTIFYPRKLLMNDVIHTETGFDQEYRHTVKGDDIFV